MNCEHIEHLGQDCWEVSVRFRDSKPSPAAIALPNLAGTRIGWHVGLGRHGVVRRRTGPCPNSQRASQSMHGVFSIFGLRTTLPRRGDDPCGNMFDRHMGFDFVAMLATGPRASRESDAALRLQLLDFASRGVDLAQTKTRLLKTIHSNISSPSPIIRIQRHVS